MAREFQRGHKAKISDLTAGTDLYVGVQIAGPGLTFDISCFGLDADEQLSDDRYFIFFNQPKSPEESIQLLGAQAGDTESFRVTLDRIPAQIQKLSFTATIDGAGQMSQVGPGYIRIVAGGEEVARYAFTGSEFTTERAVMLGDFYLKDVWRFAAVGQGFDGGLDALLKNFGGEVAEEEPAPQHPAAAAPPVAHGAGLRTAPPAVRSAGAARAAPRPGFGAPAPRAPAPHRARRSAAAATLRADGRHPARCPAPQAPPPQAPRRAGPPMSGTARAVGRPAQFGPARAPPAVRARRGAPARRSPARASGQPSPRTTAPAPAPSRRHRAGARPSTKYRRLPPASAGRSRTRSSSASTSASTGAAFSPGRAAWCSTRARSTSATRAPASRHARRQRHRPGDALMRCTGDGQVFLAEEASRVSPHRASRASRSATQRAGRPRLRRGPGARGAPDRGPRVAGRRPVHHALPGTGTVVVKTHGVPVVIPVAPGHLRRRERRRRLVGRRPGVVSRPGPAAPPAYPGDTGRP